MKKIKYMLLVLAMFLALTACGNSASEETDVSEEVTSENEPVMLFGHFESQTLGGEKVTEEIFANAELTMVNIWGTFCGPCIAEMPDLGEISREYEDKGFQIVGMLCDVMEADDETALEIVDKTKADYTHLIASDDLVKNALQYVSSVPTTAFVDKEGNLVGEIYSGARDKETWEQIINEYLEEVQ